MSRNITPCWNHSYCLQLTNQTPLTQGPTQLEIKCMEEERGGRERGLGSGVGAAWKGKGTVQAFIVPTLPDRPPASPGESPAGTTPARQRRVPTVPDAKGHPGHNCPRLSDPQCPGTQTQMGSSCSSSGWLLSVCRSSGNRDRVSVICFSLPAPLELVHFDRALLEGSRFRSW